jgi:hypothetical protein
MKSPQREEKPRSASRGERNKLEAISLAGSASRTMKKTSPVQRERLLRERRAARPFPDDWTDWDTRYALMAAERWEDNARLLLRRRRLDPGDVDEALEAARDARAVAEQSTKYWEKYRKKR